MYNGLCLWHLWRTRKVHAKFRWGELKEIDNLEDVAIKENILQWILKKWNWRVWIELFWLRMGANGGL
jgi:hypothetical protein